VRPATLLLLCAFPVAASAADIRVLSAAAVAPGLAKVADQFRRETGNRVRIQLGTTPQLERRLSVDDTIDILIAAPGLMNDQLRRNKVEPEKHVFIGRVGIGVAVRSGTPDPDIATLEGFKRSVTTADAIVYTDAGSGLYLDKLLDLLGIGEQLKAKTFRYASATQVLEHLAGGKGVELGFATIPEIRLAEDKGIKLAGPLPDQIQSTTTYSAAVVSDAPDAEAAEKFVQYLDAPVSRAIFAAAGFDN
jgi:molybdate transport system substrate-binding protein